MTIKRFGLGTRYSGSMGLPDIVGKVDGEYVLHSDYALLEQQCDLQQAQLRKQASQMDAIGAGGVSGLMVCGRSDGDDTFEAVPAPQHNVPECPFPCGWKALHRLAVQDGAYLAKLDWPEDEEGVSVTKAVVMRNLDSLITICRAMLAAAPTPPTYGQAQQDADKVGAQPVGEVTGQFMGAYSVGNVFFPKNGPLPSGTKLYTIPVAAQPASGEDAQVEAPEIAQLGQALKDCQTVAIIRGDQFLPDCIDNTGRLYQSAHLAALLDNS